MQCILTAVNLSHFGNEKPCTNLLIKDLLIAIDLWDQELSRYTKSNNPSSMVTNFVFQNPLWNLIVQNKTAEQ